MDNAGFLSSAVSSIVAPGTVRALGSTSSDAFEGPLCMRDSQGSRYTNSSDPILPYSADILRKSPYPSNRRNAKLDNDSRKPEDHLPIPEMLPI